MPTLELLYDFIEEPSRACEAVRRTRPLAAGLLGFLIGGSGFLAAQALSNRLHFLSFSWACLAAVVAWKIVFVFILAGVLHLILQFQGRQGDAVALFILFGLTELAWALALPLVLLLKAAAASPWLISTAFLLVGLLSLGLKARSLQDDYGLSAGRAWLTLSLPYLVVAAVLALAVSLLALRLLFEAVRVLA
ncbi:MAG: hypothetical protein KGO96_09750 [Elusimicrobia bacterium]|nr:hypothetical protein [Elusimicrobiota bacterium]MDE2238292.1 hypothetical protein [Elusimicrobiota bacterium]MDE2426172.1 hypothetical protein [Elusimicrobiota bacterium]